MISKVYFLIGVTKTGKIPFSELKGVTKENKVAKGSYGVVFKAQWSQTKKYVAVKKLKASEMNTSDFIKEVSIMQKLRHPNIINTFGWTQDPTNESYFIVMEFLEKGDLRSLLDNQKGKIFAKGSRFCSHDLQPLGLVFFSKSH